MGEKPRLDKFVMRGFTASSGNSSGSWVSREQGASVASGCQLDANSGSNFTLGGNGQPYKSGSALKKDEYDLQPDFKNEPLQDLSKDSKSKKDKDRTPLINPTRIISGDGLADAELHENTRMIKAILAILVLGTILYYYYKSDSGSDRIIYRPMTKSAERPINKKVVGHPLLSPE